MITINAQLKGLILIGVEVVMTLMKEKLAIMTVIMYFNINLILSRKLK
jgi:hypothetical protein